MTDYQNAYQRLVGELGKKGASEEMKRRRGLVLKPGFASMDKERVKQIQAQGQEALRLKRKKQWTNGRENIPG